MYKQISMLTLLSAHEQQASMIIWLAELKSLLYGTEGAGIHTKVLASDVNLEYNNGLR